MKATESSSSSYSLAAPSERRMDRKKERMKGKERKEKKRKEISSVVSISEMK